MIILVPDGGSACQHCGRVYNPYLGDRFWSGHPKECPKPDECESDGEEHDFVCNRCHRELYREPDRW